MQDVSSLLVCVLQALSCLTQLKLPLKLEKSLYIRTEDWYGALESGVTHSSFCSHIFSGEAATGLQRFHFWLLIAVVLYLPSKQPYMWDEKNVKEIRSEQD